MTKQDVLSGLSQRLFKHIEKDASGNEVLVDNIEVATDVQIAGDRVYISVDRFLGLFGAAASLSHAELSKAAPLGSGWHKHFDDWRDKGLIK